jgi:hypothetical protein
MMRFLLKSVTVGVVSLGAIASSTSGQSVDIALRVVTPLPVNAGDQVRIDLVLTAHKGDSAPFDALAAILVWDPARLDLVDNDQSFQSAKGLYFSGFLPDADLINEVVEPLTPSDGDAYFQGFTVGQTFQAPAPPDGFVATSFIFQALVPTLGTNVQLVPTMGAFAETRVLLFGQEITGDIGGPVSIPIGPFGACCLGSGVCQVLPQSDCSTQGGTYHGDDTLCEGLGPCPADVNHDGQVDADDLVLVILNWGSCTLPGVCCSGDTDDSGAVDADDLVAVILAWGPC